MPSPDGHRCGHCLRSPPAFDVCRAACRFVYPLSSLIHAFKYEHARWLGPHLARLMHERLTETAVVDAIIPMPIDPARLLERGYNQAYDLAKALAHRRKLPLLARAVTRRASVYHQAGLPIAERKKNVRGVFALSKELPSRIAIVDDVVTSAASMNELAKTLRSGGVRYIEAWTLARTYPPTDH